ncbi:hypothetical protein [Bacillus sp. V5-8f]|uniref:hypothetical protein n=1 Tax=Bacillus sp. V5-8f TaxID=2053044 RepID=UPI000C784CD1|nr:hypothetical protein [Bacillus sp. V5-8f]PLT35803.1 hypothetical protein CUU64_00575 [Bacillus sp. V5-8f]
MKILLIAILMLGLLMALSLALDILMGFEIRHAWHNAVNPFQVMESAELGVLYLLIFLSIIVTLLPYYQKKRKK